MDGAVGYIIRKLQGFIFVFIEHLSIYIYMRDKPYLTSTNFIQNQDYFIRLEEEYWILEDLLPEF